VALIAPAALSPREDPDLFAATSDDDDDDGESESEADEANGQGVVGGRLRAEAEMLQQRAALEARLAA
jgi:hypothetical protein